MTRSSTDIVERLRNFAVWNARQSHYEPVPLTQEAAAEIERLRRSSPDSAQLFKREPREGSYTFVTAPLYPGWSYMISPGESDIGLHQSFVRFLEAVVENERPAPLEDGLLACPLCHSANVDRGFCFIDGPRQDAMRCRDCGCRATKVAWDARSSAATEDDPTASAGWNAGCDFAMMQLCRFLEVDPNSINWDAATETVDGDVQAVIGNILRAKFGEDWGPDDSALEATPTKEDFAKWSRAWHDTCETILTLLDLPGGGSPQEMLAQVQAYAGSRPAAQPSAGIGDDLDPGTVARNLRGLESRMQYRVEAIEARDGKGKGAIEGQGIGIGYLLAKDLAEALGEAATLVERINGVAQPSAGTSEPVAYRWRQPGNKHWIYDPTPEWIEDHKHEIELEPLFNGVAQSAWRPIETAPKDGTEILGWWCRGRTHAIISWSSDGWWMDRADGGMVNTPTNWQPLQDGPSLPSTHQPCPGCDGHECDEGCAYPGAISSHNHETK